MRTLVFHCASACHVRMPCEKLRSNMYGSDAVRIQITVCRLERHGSNLNLQICLWSIDARGVLTKVTDHPGLNWLVGTHCGRIVSGYLHIDQYYELPLWFSSVYEISMKWQLQIQPEPGRWISSTQWLWTRLGVTEWRSFPRTVQLLVMSLAVRKF